MKRAIELLKEIPTGTIDPPPTPEGVRLDDAATQNEDRSPASVDMTPERERLIEQRTSLPEQPIPADVAAAVAAAAPTPPEQAYVLLAEPDVVLTEAQMQRLIIDGLAGRRKLPTDPQAAAIAKQIWAELDDLPPGAVVEIPGSLP